MIELDIINPSDTLRFTIQNVWPDYMYIYDEGEHFRVRCDTCTFWNGNYTLMLKYEYALISLILYSKDFEQVRNITKNKRRLY